MVQALGQMVKVEQPFDLDKMLIDLYQKNKDLVHGRLSNEQVYSVIQDLTVQYLSKKNFEVQVDTQKSMWKAERNLPEKKWTDLDGVLLDTHPNEIKIIAYSVIDSKGTVLGRHFVLLKERIKKL